MPESGLRADELGADPSRVFYGERGELTRRVWEKTDR
jgi:hypothetical protein